MGGRGREKAERLADDAILHTFETMANRVRSIPSPIAYAKRIVCSMIHKSRRNKIVNVDYDSELRRYKD